MNRVHSGRSLCDARLCWFVQVAGVDLEQLVREVKGDWTKEQPIADFQAGSERVQIYLDGLA